MFFYKAFRKLYRILNISISTFYVKFVLFLFKVPYGVNLSSRGIAIIDKDSQGVLEIGSKFVMNNGNDFNRIGRQQKCFLIVFKGAELKIGNNVKMSSTALVCQNKITIADNVMIGGNTVIYDTDFHSLDYRHRKDRQLDKANVISKPVVIEKNAFIGAHSTILKGVTIGENSIIAACSVVTKNVGTNELWGGNPAKFIRSI